MKKTYIERLPLAITLGLFVSLAHIGALTAIVFKAYQHFLTVMNQCPKISLDYYTEVFRGELICPQIEVPGFARMSVKCINPQTGKSREMDLLGVDALRGFVTNGKTLWGIGDDDRIYESDGLTAKTFRTDRKLNVNPSPFNRVFLFDGSPAIIDHNGNFTPHLFVLINHDWKDFGQIALPSANYTWILDEQTGKPTKIALSECSETSILSYGFTRAISATTNNVAQWRNIRVLSSSEKYHLCRFEQAPGNPAISSVQINHRTGFEFVATPKDDQPASAFAPSNAPADASAWELLPLKLNASWNLSFAIHNDRLCIAGIGSSDQISNVWAQKLNSDHEQDSPNFESILSEELTTRLRAAGGTVSLTTDSEANDLYVILRVHQFDASVYKMIRGKFVRCPCRIEGYLSPILRWIGLVLLQILMVFWCGSVLFFIGSTRLATRSGPSSYSFGEETVLLASLNSRTLARMIDLAVLLSPLMVQSIQRFSQEKLWTFLSTVMIIVNDPKTIFTLIGDMKQHYYDHLIPFTFALAWFFVAWFLIVLLTAYGGQSPGKWLCRIRVIRTTIRPCGFARSLLRELLICVDAPLLLTAIPAVVAWLATDYRQRIGDIFADTIVVRVGSAKVGHSEHQDDSLAQTT